MIAAGYVLLQMQGGIVLAFTNIGRGMPGWLPVLGGIPCILVKTT